MGSTEQWVAQRLRITRALLAIAGLVYLCWWFLVEALLPGSFNPLGGRLVVVGSFVVVLAASYASAWVHRHLAAFFAACVSLLTVHYLYLVWVNDAAPTWWGGLIITVAAVAACLQHRRTLLLYSLLACGLSLALAIADGRAAVAIFPAGVVTVLLLSNLALRSRERTEEERLLALRSHDERDQARAANELKTTFLRLVSHELLTPLQSIQLNMDILARKPDAPTSQRLAREQRVQRSVRRLTDLVESILEFARTETGQLRAVDDDIELASLAAELVDNLQGEAAEKNLALDVQSGPDVPPLRSDPKLVRLVLSNLLTNALKYTVTGRVTVLVTHGAEGHRLSVEDTGPGISPEDRERIFQPFTQLEALDHKHVKGVGLGLTLVQQMTSALGARIDLTSTVGVGSCFSIVFPVVALGGVA